MGQPLAFKINNDLVGGSPTQLLPRAVLTVSKYDDPATTGADRIQVGLLTLSKNRVEPKPVFVHPTTPPAINLTKKAL